MKRTTPSVSRSKISHKYQIVIPKSLRVQLKLKRGEFLEARKIRGRRAIELVPAKRWPDDYIGQNADLWGSEEDVQAYIRRERASWDN